MLRPVSQLGVGESRQPYWKGGSAVSYFINHRGQTNLAGSSDSINAGSIDDVKKRGILSDPIAMNLNISMEKGNGMCILPAIAYAAHLLKK